MRLATSLKLNPPILTDRSTDLTELPSLSIRKTGLTQCFIRGSFYGGCQNILSRLTTKRNPIVNHAIGQTKKAKQLGDRRGGIRAKLQLGDNMGIRGVRGSKELLNPSHRGHPARSHLDRICGRTFTITAAELQRCRLIDFYRTAYTSDEDGVRKDFLHHSPTMAGHSTGGLINELITPIGPSIKFPKEPCIGILQFVKVKELDKLLTREVGAPAIKIDLMMNFLQQGQRMGLTVRGQPGERCNQFSNE